MEQSPAAVQSRLHHAVRDLLGRRDLVGAEVEPVAQMDGAASLGVGRNPRRRRMGNVTDGGKCGMDQ
jgi:hypothetical protein